MLSCDLRIKIDPPTNKVEFNGQYFFIMINTVFHCYYSSISTDFGNIYKQYK